MLRGARIENLPSYFLLFFSTMAATGAFAMDMYLPAIPTMAKALDVGIVAMNNTVSSFLVGYGLGQFLGGPISDQVGRKTVGLIGLGLFMVASLGIMFAGTVEQIQVLRGLQALGAGFSAVVCMAAVRDAFPPEEAGRKYALVIMIMLLAPLVAPVIGAFLLDFGWPAIFAALFVFGAVVFSWYWLGVPETRIVAKKKVNFGIIFSQYRDVIIRRVDGQFIPMKYLLSQAFSGGVLMVFLTNASFAYMEYFGVSPKVFPLLVAANVILMITTIRISMKLMASMHPDKIYRKGLWAQLTATALLLLSVSLGDPSLFIVFPLMVLSVGTMGFINPNSSAIFISYYDQLSGSASSINALIFFAIGASLSVFSGVIFDGSLIPIAATMFVSCLICNLIGWTIPRQVKMGS